MRGGLLSIILVLLLSVSVFAAPSAPPFEMDGMGDSESTDSDSSSEEKEDTFQTTATETNTPPEPTIPGTSSTQNEQNNQNTAISTESFSNKWIVGIFIMLCLNFILLLIIVLSSAIHILKGKHPYLVFKYSKEAKGLPQYKNTPDAIQYTETFQKLEGYMRQYMNDYSYDQIKTVLLNEGFTADEIEAVYLEVRKHAN